MLKRYLIRNYHVYYFSLEHESLLYMPVNLKLSERIMFVVELCSEGECPLSGLQNEDAGGSGFNLR